MKRAPRSRQRHDLYAKYHDYDSEISDLLGECGITRHGKPADPEKFKGVYRLRLPLEGEVVAAPPAAGDVDE